MQVPVQLQRTLSNTYWGDNASMSCAEWIEMRSQSKTMLLRVGDGIAQKSYGKGAIRVFIHQRKGQRTPSDMPGTHGGARELGCCSATCTAMHVGPPWAAFEHPTHSCIVTPVCAHGQGFLPHAFACMKRPKALKAGADDGFAMKTLAGGLVPTLHVVFGARRPYTQRHRHTLGLPDEEACRRQMRTPCHATGHHTHSTETASMMRACRGSPLVALRGQGPTRHDGASPSSPQVHMCATVLLYVLKACKLPVA